MLKEVNSAHLIIYILKDADKIHAIDVVYVVVTMVMKLLNIVSLGAILWEKIHGKDVSVAFEINT